jgi:hypothetical protein
VSSQLCCAQDIPQRASADARAALEASTLFPHDLTVLVAETRDANRRRRRKALALGAAAGAAAAADARAAAAAWELPGLRRRVGVVCYLCGAASASRVGLDFHRAACVRQWDRRERCERPPHRRRLFGWRKSDPDTQLPGEK